MNRYIILFDAINIPSLCNAAFCQGDSQSPRTIPVLSKEESKNLIKKNESFKDMEKEYGRILFKERFLSFSPSKENEFINNITNWL